MCRLLQPILVACTIFLLIACSCSCGPPPAENSSPATQTATPKAITVEIDLTTASWELPDIDPCTLVTEAEAEAVMGPLKGGPKPGGSALDGTTCVYVSTSPLVVSIGVISTVSFELQKRDPGNTALTDLGAEAYTLKPNAFKDVCLFVRKGRATIMVNVSAALKDDLETERYRIAKGLAERALDRLLTVMR